MSVAMYRSRQHGRQGQTTRKLAYQGNKPVAFFLVSESGGFHSLSLLLESKVRLSSEFSVSLSFDFLYMYRIFSCVGVRRKFERDMLSNAI